MNIDSKIYVAGHRGMVGSAIVRVLGANGAYNIFTRTHNELDLTNQMEVRAFFENEKIDQVYFAAAKVGGIHANNTYPAEFIYQNLIMQSNVIDAAYHNGVKKLMFLGSSCIYPKQAPQPIMEEYLLTGAFESTNEPYAIAKIAGIKLCESYNRQYGVHYRSIMPTNLYGPNDNFCLENGHVIPSMIRKFHEAKINNMLSVKVWGSGQPMREFLHVDDMAAASIYVMNVNGHIYDGLTDPMLSHINVGTGEEVTIAQLSKIVKQITGFRGEILFDREMPDGTPRKLLDVSRLKSMGWQYNVSLEQGLKNTYEWFLNNIETIRK